MNFIELLLPRVIPLLSILYPHPCIPGWLPLSSWMTTAHLAFHCQIDFISRCGGKSFPRVRKGSGKSSVLLTNVQTAFFQAESAHKGSNKCHSQSWRSSGKKARSSHSDVRLVWIGIGSWKGTSYKGKEMMKTIFAKFEEQVSNRPLHHMGNSASWALLAGRGRVSLPFQSGLGWQLECWSSSGVPSKGTAWIYRI